MSVTLHVDTSDWDRKSELVRASIIDFIPRFTRDGTELVQQELANQVPVKTGNLRASISSVISGNSSETGTHTGYGKFVDQPTKPHSIRPNISHFLHFNIGGEDIFAKEVQHPGTMGKFFIRATASIVIPKLKDLARQIWISMVGGA